MKQILKNVEKSYRHKLLATSIAAALTALVAASVTQASDIDIYQEARSGDITLMFMLDISGSMGAPQQLGYSSSCDIPKGTSVASHSNEDSINGSPTYKRYYCMVNYDAYFYKRTGSTGNYQYFNCGASGSRYSADCENPIPALPTDSREMTQSGTGTIYYYRPKSTAKYYDRITRLKDGLFDLLHGNTSKGITKLDDTKVIGLSTYSRPTSFNSSGQPLTADNVTGQVRIPARSLGELVGGITQRQLLLNEIAALGARGGTPTANAYAETAAYLFGTRTRGATTAHIPMYFKYFPVLSSSKVYMYWKDGNKNSSLQYECNGNVGVATISACTSKTNRVKGNITLEYDLSGGKRYYYKMVSTTSTTPHYQTCVSYNAGGCDEWGVSGTVNPTTASYTDSCWVDNNSGVCAYEEREITTSLTDSGFLYSYPETKNAEQTLYVSPASLIQTDDMKQCSGQGIYVLTDGAPNNNNNARGLMQAALAERSSTLSCTNSTSGWNCMHNFTKNLLDAAKNPLGLKIKTAVVGFGSGFNSIDSFNRALSQEENLKPFLRVDSNGNILRDINGNALVRTDLSDQESAAYWGVIGEGGWYSGNSSEDIVKSVNAFLGDLGTEIPSVTTGSPTIPKDALNPVVLQDDAYYQQFQPTPDKDYGLWVGNLKKYTVGVGGKLQGKSNRNVHDNRGRLIEPAYDDNGKLLSAVYDFWSYNISDNTTTADADENTLGSRKFAAKGGAWSQLKLRSTAEGVVQRKLLTNRVGTGSGTSAAFTSSNNALRTVNLDYLTDATYKDDPKRGYLLSLLGYKVDAADPNGITSSSLAVTPELRQVGAVMHSLPVLVTNKGKVTFNAVTKKIGSTNRDDYVLFGTTQGLLHVVDAQTGQEKFAFVPNEMVENQHQGFMDYSLTSGGVNHLYYGIDGPWTVHTEYVIDGSGNLTVGSGKGTNQKGKQLAFGGLRMGGRSYYSLDLQNINSPKLNFHINPAAETSGPLSYMGESWSKPSIGYVNWGGARKLVMFVGGGYDRTGGLDGKGYESYNYNQTNKKGAGVYMFSAEGSDAGSLLWWASANAGSSSSASTDSGVIRTHHDDLKYSVVSEIRTVDRDGDDLIDHLYFGDLGGQVFRVDLNNKATKLGGFARTPVRLLNLNNAEKSPRFYDMPSFSIYNEKGITFAVISIGSGNRSQPLQSYTVGTSGIVNDAIYNIYDKDVARKDLYTASSLNTQNITGLALLTEDNRYSNTTPVAPYSTNGWYYQFNNCVAGSDGTREGCNDYKLQSEKVFGTPLAMNYRLYVSTFDSSKPGISGNCGAGVKGESFMSTFCMPFGQCKSKDPADGGGRGEPIGIGIQNITTGNDKVCVGEDCDDQGGGGGTENEQKSRVASSSNYCANTGGRILVTTTGAGGVGQETQMCLIPQRWYEKNSLIR
ncbi:pilus assembly protein PilY [Acinetobacter indicus]|uniref:pilus assembly protein PilY n=1 Tax=Acinetobacter indicus TaxID=756892 RepID=UPI002575205F|nr:pilus assembly protein PilY [Acinetobacter indicus]MDM1329620.1 pilus assembly protein PilY [Acinetobacter indicus]MDM1338019.1 pilus assembly protein PilY [Acinetobacter indicus]